jgi:tetratricopeptide (TPR) repeat protein
MSTKQTKQLILWIVVAQIVLIAGILALPPAVQAIPGRYRVALAERSPFLSGILEGVMDQVAPVATALPAPQTVSASEQIDISQLLGEEPDAIAVTLAPTATDEPTAVPTPEPEATEIVAPTATSEPTAVPTAAPSPTPEPLPERVLLDGMGVIRQTFNNCGPANLTQVLNFHQYGVTQEEVRLALKPNSEDRNVSPWQIQDFVNEQTPYRAIARSNGNIEMLKRFIAAGLPVVVEKGYWLQESGWWGHYLTLYGYDNALQEFRSQDSYLGPWDGSGRPAGYADLEEFWQQFNYTFYVIYEPSQEELVNSILGAEMLDDFTMWQLTAVRADEETRANPENPYAWFNLGVAMTRMGSLTGEAQYYQAGAQAFDTARQIGLPPRMLWYQFEAYLAYFKIGRNDDVLSLADATLETQGGRNVEETFWYRGHALHALGDLGGARTAYETALQVNPNFGPAQISLDYVISLGG